MYFSPHSPLLSNFTSVSFFSDPMLLNKLVSPRTPQAIQYDTYKPLPASPTLFSDPMPTNVALYYTTCDAPTNTVGNPLVTYANRTAVAMVRLRTRPRTKRTIQRLDHSDVRHGDPYVGRAR